MLELHEILRVSDAVACRIDFILLRDRGRQGEGGGEGGGGGAKTYEKLLSLKYL